MRHALSRLLRGIRPARRAFAANDRQMIDFTSPPSPGNAEILQLSGGEPTLHPQILEILGYARSTKLAYVMLNTNGLRLAADELFVRKLARSWADFEVYLQFDGLEWTVRPGISAAGMPARETAGRRNAGKA